MLANLTGPAFLLSAVLRDLLRGRLAAPLGMGSGFRFETFLLALLFEDMPGVQTGSLRVRFKAQPGARKRFGYLHDASMVFAFGRYQQAQQNRFGILAG
ncbi:hypothetical protein [Stutzerimonas nitrititolerans]|uniref:hypothetical protein n=1 Tax=Stutzerimonas nitrititolerans TaxID=2482751 RepID=UPI0028A90A0C|nr:hypothetical protein [Stutzerimonas nitrititolerans]